MDWNRGYSAKYYVTIVDKTTMKDMNVDDLSSTRIEIISGTIQRSYEGLRESADLTCENYSLIKETYIRVWLDTSQNGGSSHTPLFTGIASSPSRNINGGVEKTSMQCYSMLKLADDILLPRGWYAPYDANSGDLIRSLLSVVGTEVNIHGDPPKLKYSIIAESGETNLTMVDKILSSVNWRMKLDGLGNINLSSVELAKEPLVTFDSLTNDIIEPTLSVQYDWFNTPNVVRVVLDNEYSVVKDEDPNSPFSIDNRGREVWAEDVSGEINSDESLPEYAYRRLREYQQNATTISYDRRYIPDLYPYDSVSLNYPAQKLFGTYLITSQLITLGYNAKTSEEVIKI